MTEANGKSSKKTLKPSIQTKLSQEDPEKPRNSCPAQLSDLPDASTAQNVQMSEPIKKVKPKKEVIAQKNDLEAEKRQKSEAKKSVVPSKAIGSKGKNTTSKEEVKPNAQVQGNAKQTDNQKSQTSLNSQKPISKSRLQSSQQSERLAHPANRTPKASTRSKGKSEQSSNLKEATKSVNSKEKTNDFQPKSLSKNAKAKSLSKMTQPKSLSKSLASKEQAVNVKPKEEGAKASKKSARNGVETDKATIKSKSSVKIITEKVQSKPVTASEHKSKPSVKKSVTASLKPEKNDASTSLRLEADTVCDEDVNANESTAVGHQTHESKKSKASKETEIHNEIVGSKRRKNDQVVNK